jgi:hypothetical protein
MLGERLTYTHKPQFALFHFKYVSAISMAAILFIAIVSYGLFQKSSEPYYVVAIEKSVSQLQKMIAETVNKVPISKENSTTENEHKSNPKSAQDKPPVPENLKAIKKIVTTHNKMIINLHQAEKTAEVISLKNM